jgi:hypothetical protein
MAYFDQSPFILFYKSSSSEWITLDLYVYQFQCLSISWEDALKAVGVEPPPWFVELRKLLQDVTAATPIPTDNNYFNLPTVQGILNDIPFVINSGFAFPKEAAGYQEGGLIILPGGDVDTWSPPFQARLCDIVFRGYSIFVQGGLLSGSMSVVSCAELHYRIDSQPRILYPAIDIVGFSQGIGCLSGNLYHSPDSQGNCRGGGLDIWAQTQIQYLGGGHYNVNNYWVMGCPTGGDIPAWHFLAGQRPLMTAACYRQENKIIAAALVDTYTDSDSLDDVPRGCSGGFPTPEALAAHDLLLGTYVPPTLMRVEKGANYNDNHPGFSGLGINPEDTSVGGVVVVGESEPIFTSSQLSKSLCFVAGGLISIMRRQKASRQVESLEVNGELCTIGGFPIVFK